MSRRGRQPIFTDDQVREIRKAAQPCEHCGKKATYQELADRYGVSRPMIYYILSGRNYSHVD